MAGSLDSYTDFPIDTSLHLSSLLKRMWLHYEWKVMSTLGVGGTGNSFNILERPNQSERRCHLFGQSGDSHVLNRVRVSPVNSNWLTVPFHNVVKYPYLQLSSDSYLYISYLLTTRCYLCNSLGPLLNIVIYTLRAWLFNYIQHVNSRGNR